MIANKMTMTKKKKVMSKKIRYTSESSPSGGSMTSPIPPPALTPWYRWNTKHWTEKKIKTLEISTTPHLHKKLNSHYQIDYFNIP